MGFRFRARKPNRSIEFASWWLVSGSWVHRRKVVEEVVEKLVGQARELIDWK